MENDEVVYWKKTKTDGNDGAHYAIIGLERHECGMQALRAMFPDGKANDINFVLFSTSGVHGTYNTIEEAEKYVHGDSESRDGVTFLVVHPRLVALRWGECYPRTQGDIDFLKCLRESSHKEISEIGI